MTYKLTTMFHNLLRSISLSSVIWAGLPPHFNLSTSPGRSSAEGLSDALLLLHKHNEGQYPTPLCTQISANTISPKHFMMPISVKTAIKTMAPRQIRKTITFSEILCILKWHCKITQLYTTTVKFYVVSVGVYTTLILLEYLDIVLKINKTETTHKK